jgi:hypothetical protein
VKSLQYVSNRISIGKSDLVSLADEVSSGIHHFLKKIPKRRGGSRDLRIPDGELAMVLKKLLEYFYTESWDLSPVAFGFVKGRTTVQHARLHLAKPEVLHMDLDNFFASVSAQQIREALETAEYSPEAVATISRLVCYDNSLPQGFPTSPFLSNVVFRDLDRHLASLADKLELSYSRYADDLVFSGSQTDRAIAPVAALVSNAGWAVNPAKTRVQYRGNHQYVAGLTVFDHVQPRLPRSLKRRYRAKAHMIAKVGYEVYCAEFGDESEDFPRRLIGMARYMASVEPDVGQPILQVFLSHIDLDYFPQSEEDWPGEIAAIRDGWG